MFRPHAVLAVVVSYSLFLTPVHGATPAAIGTVTSASSARVGATAASVGSTVFSGDHLSTDRLGSIQVRAGAARFLLSGASSAALSDNPAAPGATLLSGTAVFSTASAKAFVLHASTAQIRPRSDEPTVVQVTYVNDKELRLRCNRGSVSITVDDETRFVTEGTAYRVILDPDAYIAAGGAVPASTQGPQGAGTRRGGPPLKAGRSRFLLIAIIITGIATGVALYEALQSPDRP